MKCCRCGQEPRHLDTFLCLVCLNDGGTRTDMQEAQRYYPNVREQREYLVEELRWHGGWLLRTEERVA